MALLSFLKWAKTSKTPVRNAAGELVVWDDSANDFVTIEAFGLVSLYMGEIGETNVQLREQVTQCEQKLTANDLSSVNVSFHDPGFQMYKNGVFELERTLNFNGYFYRITSVTTAYKEGSDLVRVDADSYNGYKLKEDKGQATFSMSPTAFAESKAAEMGLTFFGEITPEGDPIVRRQDENTDESTWDVLKRLANENDFSLFESNNRLFFASDREIIAGQEAQVINLPADSSDPLVLLSADFKKSIKDKFDSRVDFRFHKNAPATRLTPGMAVRCIGMGDYDAIDLMIENVVFDASPTSQVKITTRSSEPRGGCKSEVFKRGDKGECVRRIQTAVRQFTRLVYTSTPERVLKPNAKTLSRDEQFFLDINDAGTSGSIQRDPVNPWETYKNLSAPVVVNAPDATRSQFFQDINTVRGDSGPVNPWNTYSKQREREAVNSSVRSESVKRTVQLTIDGVFDADTETAVRQFQTREGLPSTGIVDAATWVAIERAT
jgi:peptidoglycan hydrolase-like protein with peptidoglycan-binding domain